MSVNHPHLSRTPVLPKCPSTIEMIPMLREWAKRTSCVNVVHLFGSRVRGDFRPDSDLDIALEISPKEGDENAFTTWISEAAKWCAEIQKYTPVKIQLEWLDRSGKTPTVLAGVHESGLMIYLRGGDSFGEGARCLN